MGVCYHQLVQISRCVGCEQQQGMAHSSASCQAMCLFQVGPLPEHASSVPQAFLIQLLLPRTSGVLPVPSSGTVLFRVGIALAASF